MTLVHFARSRPAVAQSMARELGPKNIHVAHLIIDAGVDTAWVRERIGQRSGPEALERLEPDQLMNPGSITDTHWQPYQQPRDGWTFELDVRPYGEVALSPSHLYNADHRRLRGRYFASAF